MVALLKMPVAATRRGAERRLFVRKDTHLTVMGRRLDRSFIGRRFPTLRLHVRDVSIGGISAIIDEPLGEGERLSVDFPARDQGVAWEASGRVLRCEPSSTGYRIALEFDPLPAA